MGERGGVGGWVGERVRGVGGSVDGWARGVGERGGWVGERGGGLSGRVCKRHASSALKHVRVPPPPPTPPPSLVGIMVGLNQALGISQRCLGFLHHSVGGEATCRGVEGMWVGGWGGGGLGAS